MSSGISLEVRTTVFPGMPSPSEVREIAEALSALKSEFPGHGLELFVLQQGQPREAEFEPVPSGKLRELAASLQSLVDVRVRDAPRARPSRDR
jgi:pyruvate-formate lyase-activating enzyme